MTGQQLADTYGRDVAHKAIFRDNETGDYLGSDELSGTRTERLEPGSGFVKGLVTPNGFYDLRDGALTGSTPGEKFDYALD
jgi:hypothetical protein